MPVNFLLWFCLGFVWGFFLETLRLLKKEKEYWKWNEGFLFNSAKCDVVAWKTYVMEVLKITRTWRGGCWYPWNKYYFVSPVIWKLICSLSNIFFPKVQTYISINLLLLSLPISVALRKDMMDSVELRTALSSYRYFTSKAHTAQTTRAWMCA